MTTSIVIFGASGDLTQRKLLPALFSLYCKGRLPDEFRVVGMALSDWGPEVFRERMEAALRKFAPDKFDAVQWQRFAPRLDYVPGNFTSREDFARLGARLDELAGAGGDRLYYMATPPRFYTDIVEHLAAAHMLQEGPAWRRVIIEKPFGHDLASARALNRALHEALREHQVYRIDHYLGKETVQNILVFRFANAIFDPVWNRNYIDNVQITVAETVDVGRRAGYYDGVGVLRDMFQNHLMQLLALTAMEPPVSFDADALRNEKVKVFSALRPIAAHEVTQVSARGQYRGYREADGVASDSTTPTYAALRVYIENWRWQGVPFYLRSGKALADKVTEIIVQFKCPPITMFPGVAEDAFTSNVIGLCLQPDEGIHLRFEAKVPDTAADTRSVRMDFHYAESFGPTAIPEAYERLLLDAINGDASLFTRGDAHELTWGLMDPILQGWQSEAAPPLQEYEPGGWGPRTADELLARDGRAWLRVCAGH